MDLIELGDLTVYTRNPEEAKRIYTDIFTGKEYYFECSARTPFIIDCGAHIGIATLYFKVLYPSAKVIAIEANPENVKILKKNIEFGKLKDVTVVEGAISTSEISLPFYIDPNPKDPWSWGDTTIPNLFGKDVARKEISVKSVHLDKYLTNSVDLIKLDIEGGELEALEAIESKLKFVKQLILEVHTTETMPKDIIAQVRTLLEKSGFDVSEIPSNGWALLKAINHS